MTYSLDIKAIRKLRGVRWSGVSPTVYALGVTSLLTDVSSDMVTSILPLYSGAEAVLALETRSVDDQVEWIDDHEIAYALPEDTTPAATNTWALAIDGQSPPRLLAPLAYSPAVVRQ